VDYFVEIRPSESSLKNTTFLLSRLAISLWLFTVVKENIPNLLVQVVGSGRHLPLLTIIWCKIDRLLYKVPHIPIFTIILRWITTLRWQSMAIQFAEIGGICNYLCQGWICFVQWCGIWRRKVVNLILEILFRAALAHLSSNCLLLTSFAIGSWYLLIQPWHSSAWQRHDSMHRPFCILRGDTVSAMLGNSWERWTRCSLVV
jgi:hypothetical protein